MEKEKEISFKFTADDKPLKNAIQSANKDIDGTLQKVEKASRKISETKSDIFKQFVSDPLKADQNNPLSDAAVPRLNEVIKLKKTVNKLQKENVQIRKEEIKIEEDEYELEKKRLRKKTEEEQKAKKKELDSNDYKNAAVSLWGATLSLKDLLTAPNLKPSTKLGKIESIIDVVNKPGQFDDTVNGFIDTGRHLTNKHLELKSSDGLQFYDEDDLEKYEKALADLQKKQMEHLSDYDRKRKSIYNKELVDIAEINNEKSKTLEKVNNEFTDSNKFGLSDMFQKMFSTDPKESPYYKSTKLSENKSRIRDKAERQIDSRQQQTKEELANLDFDYGVPSTSQDMVIEGSAKKRKKKNTVGITQEEEVESKPQIEAFSVGEDVKSKEQEAKDLEELQSKQIQKNKEVEDSQNSLAKTTVETNAKIIESTKESSKEQTISWEDVHKKLGEYAGYVNEGLNSIVSGMNSIIGDQLNEAKEKLSEISAQYDETVNKREESDSRIQELEEQAKGARGARALQLQQQIDAEMATNQKLAEQEKQLAKDKEKAEKEAAKKEKQMKKVELAQNIVQGMSNVALAVTKALAKGPIIGQILAGIAAAAGAVQIAIMSKQLAKFEKGGLLRGKRHSQGGMRVEGTNIEVEGGEYVVNRESTSKNLGLIRYINSQRKQLQAEDVHTYFARPTMAAAETPFSRHFEAGGELPTIVNTPNADNEQLVDAIRSMKFEPRVAVTDILRVQDEMASVDGWSGI